MKRKFKGIWIPANIWESKELTLQEKVFLVEIDSLNNGVNGCYANNTYFSKFFGLSVTRVSIVINNLVLKGYVTSEINQEEGNKRKLMTSLTNVADPLKLSLKNNNTVNNIINKDLNIDWNKLVELFNEVTGKKIKGVNEKAKRQIKVILKDYTKKDFKIALENCFNDSYHKETNHKYLTLEFISRSEKFERFYSMIPIKREADGMVNRADNLKNEEEQKWD
jgi:DNA-binding MarR family transcriptional regulator